STSRTIYAGAADGGVWRSVDGGANWTPLTDAECSLDMGSVALDPVAPSIVYAGTGEAAASYDSYFGCGVLRSTDGGMTWTQLGAQVFGNVSISKILVDAATAGSPTASTVFAATTRNFAANCLGLLRSSNSGATWAPVLTGCVTDVVQDPSTASTLYAAVAYSSNNGIYKSTDGGAHWQTRSEEHTSELQSRFDLVCRLLLEKKKKKKFKRKKRQKRNTILLSTTNPKTTLIKELTALYKNI